MKTKLIILSSMISLICASCDNYEQFEEELYQNDIYIISQDGNFKSIVCDLNSNEYTHYVSFSYTGTSKIQNDVIIETEKDTILYDKYNYTNFELDSAKYIKIFDEWRYQFPSTSFTFNANSADVYGLLPFYIQPDDIDDLCPDSTYVIPIAIKSVSSYQIKKEKSNALLRIFVKNKFAETSKNTTYGMKGYRGEGSMSGNSIGSSKVVYPLSANAVRFFVGLENPPAKNPVPEDINRISARIIINDDHSIQIEPYKPFAGLLDIEMLTPPADQDDFPWTNIYEETPPKFQNGNIGQRFLMYYRYRIKDGNGNWGDWIYMREILNRV